MKKDKEFIFYFYAIKWDSVYSHHKDVFKVKHCLFYTNEIRKDKKYVLLPVRCDVQDNKFVAKADLVQMLREQGYDTSEENHNADFYYILHVKVMGFSDDKIEIPSEELNSKNGNDSFSAHSPKVLNAGDLYGCT